MEAHPLSERDICTKFITPAIQAAGWQQAQFREEVSLTDGRVMVRGKLAARVRNPEAKGGPKRADYVLYARPNVPLAVVEAKQARFPVGQGMQQALAYAEMLDAPFAISSNGSAFLVHDRTGLTAPTEREVALDSFPTHAELWALFQQWKGLTEPTAVALVEQPFHTDGSGREPRYYQRVAINGFANREENELAWKVDFKAKREQAEAAAQPHWTRAEALNNQASAVEGEMRALRESIKGVTDPQQRKAAEDEIEALRPQAEGLRVQARDAQAAGDRIYWPIYNLDLKNPNGPDEETHDPDLLLEKYKTLLGQIQETENSLKTELASALAHHFNAEGDSEEPQA